MGTLVLLINRADTMTQALTTLAPVPLTHPCWEHIDQIYPLDRDDLFEATSKALEAIKAAMLSNGSLERSSVAVMCDHALVDLRAAESFLANAVTLMNGVSLEDN